MPRGRKSSIPVERKHLYLRAGDFDALGELFPALGSSAALRQILSKFVDNVRASQAPLALEIPNIPLEELIPNE